MGKVLCRRKLMYKPFSQILLLLYNIEYMDVITGGRDCPTNSNKHTLQLKRHQTVSLYASGDHAIYRSAAQI
jgi:hypothetical protein